MSTALGSEKLTLGFMADVLYIQGLIPYEMFEAIQDVKTANDLEDIVERMLRSEFNLFKRGEHRIITDNK
jgi:hypothetical protein